MSDYTINNINSGDTGITITSTWNTSDYIYYPGYYSISPINSISPIQSCKTTDPYSTDVELRINIKKHKLKLNFAL